MLGIILAAILYVSPVGNDTNVGTITAPLKTIQVAINKAQKGDTIYLQDGIFYQNVKINKPIKITGTGIVKGGSNGRIIEVQSSNVELNGFTVDGFWNVSQNAKSSYRDKLVYIQSPVAGQGLSNITITNMSLMNAGGECVRIKYLAHDILIKGNVITNCGIYDFVYKDGGKNGEGIYIGTAPEQLSKNPSKVNDATYRIRVSRNKITTNGNECVDIKEGSYGIIVDYNLCSGQLDPESAGMDSRGNRNIFRYNTVFNNTGAAFRLGGDTLADGIQNSVYGNHIYGNNFGILKAMRQPQGAICNNWGTDNGIKQGTYKFNAQKPC